MKRLLVVVVALCGCGSGAPKVGDDCTTAGQGEGSCQPFCAHWECDNSDHPICKVNLVCSPDVAACAGSKWHYTTDGC
jgi:hypothetical protein